MGIQANEKRINQLLNESLMLATILNSRLGYDSMCILALLQISSEKIDCRCREMRRSLTDIESYIKRAQNIKEKGGHVREARKCYDLFTLTKFPAIADSLSHSPCMMPSLKES